MKLRLKHWRERRVMSVRDLSAAAKVSSSTIIEIEKTGDAPRPSVIKKLATSLGVSDDEGIVEVVTKPGETLAALAVAK